MACGVAAIPGWVVVDRGNSVGFIVPIALVFLVALIRQRWGLVAIMVVLAALVKPQFAVLGCRVVRGPAMAVGRHGSRRVRNRQSGRRISCGRGTFRRQSGNRSATPSSATARSISRISPDNVSFGKGLLLIPDAIKAQATGGKIPDGFLDGPRLLIGYGVLVLVVVAVLVLGRRIPPVMVGIALLATASLFPSLAIRYYLVFALPIAALVVRDPGRAAGIGNLRPAARRPPSPRSASV